MKTLPAFILAAALALGLAACTDRAPTVKVQNNAASKVDVTLKTINGATTTEIKNVYPNTASPVYSVAEGTLTIEAQVEGVSEKGQASATFERNEDYVIIVSNTAPPGVTVETE